MLKNINAKITVVIPTYNRADQLRLAVKSVADQGMSEVLIHIFDNCSTDETEDTVIELSREYSRICYTKREENLGGLRNYASAIDSVATPFYLPLADDDWLLPGSLRILLDEMLADESLGAVISQTVGMSSDKREVYVNPGNDWDYKRYEPEEFFPIWASRMHFEWSSLLFRTSAMRAIGGLDIETGSPSDVDFQAQLFLRYPVKMIPYRSAVYLMHPNQFSVQYDPIRAIGIFRMIRKAKTTASRHPTKSQLLSKSADLFTNRWLVLIADELAVHGTLSDYFSISKFYKLHFNDMHSKWFFHIHRYGEKMHFHRSYIESMYNVLKIKIKYHIKYKLLSVLYR